MPKTTAPHTPDLDTDEDLSFADMMQDVVRIKSDKVERKNPTRRELLRKGIGLDYHREQASKEDERIIDGLSSEAVDLVDSEEELLFASQGVQISTLKRLKKGHLQWEAGIDLHGMTVDAARDELSQFIRDAIKHQMRCVLVVHGKSYSGAGSEPILKSYVNDWLKQLSNVIAFVSAQPHEGGTGALYVLLRQNRAK
jgi:DNA-nicking Smr family endonuclease